MTTLIWIYKFFGLPIGFGIAIVVFWFFLRNPEKFEKWVSMLAWLVSRVWKKIDYFATKTEIQGKVNSFISTLESNTAITFPRISLRWIARGKEEIIWEEGKAIIVMRDRKFRNRNLIHAVYLFTSEALLKKSSRHLSKTQKISLDLFSTKLILQKESKAAEEQFMNDYFVPEINKHEVIRGFVQQYMDIQRKGLFFPILIQELSYLGNKVFLVKPCQEVIDEVKSLVKFLEDFSQREVGDMSTPDTFVGKYMRCAIRIVASRAVRNRGDTTSHKDRIIDTIKNGFENVYIIGSANDGNRLFMDRVAEAVLAESSEVEKAKDYQFKGSIKLDGKFIKVNTYFIHLHNPSVVKYLYDQKDIGVILLQTNSILTYNRAHV